MLRRRRRVYLDACCLNRPFDDLSQGRVRLEAEAMLIVLDLIRQGELEWVGSEVLKVEISLNRDVDRRARVALLVGETSSSVSPREGERQRAFALKAVGFSDFDALHLACAESGAAEVFLTTDDRLLRRATRADVGLKVRVCNPVRWIEEVLGE